MMTNDERVEAMAAGRDMQHNVTQSALDGILKQIEFIIGEALRDSEGDILPPKTGVSMVPNAVLWEIYVSALCAGGRINLDGFGEYWGSIKEPLEPA